MSTRAIAHNTMAQIIGKIVSTILGLFAVGMMTRYLGQEKFGWYVTATTYLQFTGILIDFGLTIVTAQMLSEPEHDKDELLKNLLGFRFYTALIFLIAAPIISLFFPYPPEVKIAIAVSAISFLCIALNQVFIGFYQAKLKTHLVAIGEVLGRVVLVAGLVWLIYRQAQFLPIMGAIIAGAFVFTIFMWWQASKLTAIAFSYNRDIWLAIIKKMWPITVAVLFNAIYLKGDTVILSFLRSQSEVGLYGAAYRVLEIYSQVAMIIMGIIVPLMAFNWSRNLKEEFKKYYQMSFDIIMLIALPVLIFTLIFGTQIMVLVAGSKFTLSGMPLKILSLAVFGVYLGAVFGHTAVAINKQKQTMWVYLSTALITIIGYLIFIPIYGMYGAAWMTVFSELYTGILLFILIRRYTQTSLSYKNFGKIILAGIIMGACVWPIQHLSIFYSIVLAPIVYCLAIVNFRVISKETTKTLLHH